MSMSISSSPYSCDTFVVLPPLTDSNFHIFGKNSDRPATEVQEIIFVSNDQTSDHLDVVQVTIERCLASFIDRSLNDSSAPIFEFLKCRKPIDAFFRNLLGVGEPRWELMNMAFALVMKLYSPRFHMELEKRL